MKPFRNHFGEQIFKNKYQNIAAGCDTWERLATILTERTCGSLLQRDVVNEIQFNIAEMKFIPAGRYLYYAGRPAFFANNCFAFEAKDSREGWADLGSKHFLALMCGGGCGTLYSKVRAQGCCISKTGGIASGPISLMLSMNEIGRNVMQGGSRRSALWAGLHWNHADFERFLTIKEYTDFQKKCKEENFDFPLPLDMTNISGVYDKAWYNALKAGDTQAKLMFLKNVMRACIDGEPGFLFGIMDEWLLRNACTEFITDQDSDVCNLGSINMSRIKTIDEFRYVVAAGSKFLYCGSIKSELPYDKCKTVRYNNRKIGLGLMGVHEWLMQRNYDYRVVPELHKWLQVYEEESEKAADAAATYTNNSKCDRYRCIAPAGTISILAGTTSGIEPMFSVATKRRYLDKQQKWAEEYYIDPVAIALSKQNIDPTKFETAYKLSEDIEKRIKFQADIQEYVDMGISSTVQLPAWNNTAEDHARVEHVADLLIKYCGKLKGITFFPNGSRGGQPLTEVPIEEAQEWIDKHDRKNATLDSIEASANAGCKGGVCGI